jgi:hypothetical protein
MGNCHGVTWSNVPTFGSLEANSELKFKEMYSCTMPTGDPDCPEHIRIAKCLHLTIQRIVPNTDSLDGGKEKEVGA